MLKAPCDCIALINTFAFSCELVSMVLIHGFLGEIAFIRSSHLAFLLQLASPYTSINSGVYQLQQCDGIS